MTQSILPGRPSGRTLSSRLPGRGVAGAILVGLAIAIALFAPWLAPFDPNASNLLALSSPPSLSSGHYLGTDDLGRDILSRIFYGARPVLLVATVSTLLALLLGATLGVLAGYAGGAGDQLLGRLADIQLTIPGLILALLAVALFGSSIPNLIIILALESWPLHFRVARNHARNARTQAYVEAAWLAGVPAWRIIWRHVLPGVLPLLVVTATISAAFIVMTEAGLSFIGLGVQPPTADWGLMIAQGKAQLGAAWWLSIFPALALLLLLLGIQMIGDALSRHLSVGRFEVTQ